MSVAAGPSLVDATLAADRATTLDALAEHLPADDGRSELRALCADYPARPSKGIRPALCLSTCRAFGGEAEDAIGAAVALELLHNGFLVHDDICDDAERRRGKPSLHVEHGVPMALSVGDALTWAALGPLLESARLLGPRLGPLLLEEFQQLTSRTIEGQVAEIAWRDRDLNDLDEPTYLALIRDKTSWYSAMGPCRVGALIGSRGRSDLDAPTRYGFFLGALLQLRDDIENVTDREGGRGKDFGSDVVEGKPTLLVIHLLRNLDGAAKEEALSLLGASSDAPPDERVNRIVELMESRGSIDHACAFADGLAGAALAELEGVAADLPDSGDLEFLRRLVLHLRDPVIRGR